MGERPSIEIVTADTPDVRRAAFELRYRVYIEEMGKTLGDADHGRKVLTDPMDETGVIFCAVLPDGGMAATLRVNIGRGSVPGSWRYWYGLDRFSSFGDDELSFSSRLIVAPEWRGSLVLSELLATVYRFGLERGTRFNFCDCRPGLVRFYERLGYRRYTRNFVEPEFGFCVPLVLLAEDTGYLESIHSPFWRIARWEVKTASPSDWFRREFADRTGCRPQSMAGPDDLWLFLAGRLHDESIPLFNDLQEEEIRALMRDATVLKGRAGEPIVRRGDVGSEMFILVDGAAEVRADVGGREVDIEMLGRGDVFGEMAFLSHLPRSADVVALTDVEVLVLTEAFLKRFIQGRPEAAARVLYNLSLILCGRLRMSTRHWLEALGERDWEESPPTTGIPDTGSET